MSIIIYVLLIIVFILFILFKKPTATKISLFCTFASLAVLFMNLNAPMMIPMHYISLFFFVLCFIEIFWDVFDNQFTGADGTFKLVICIILFLLGIASIITGTYLGLPFTVLGFILLGMGIFEMFSNKLDKKVKSYKGIVCVVSALACLLSALSIIKYPGLIIWLSMGSLLFFLSFVFSLFDVPGFNSPAYVLILFLLSNMPIVYWLVTQLNNSSDKIDFIYIPLLISFYVCSIFILYMMGSLSLDNANSIFMVLGAIASIVMYYLKAFPISLTKIVFTLVTMIVLFISTMHYMFYSDSWYQYLILYYTILSFGLYKWDFESMKLFLMQYLPIISKKNSMYLGAEVAVILLYLYTRSFLKKVYTIGGKMAQNAPVNLQTQIHINLSKNYEYNYSLSFWVYINPINPSSTPQATEFIPFLSYGDKPLFTYNSLQNIIRVQMKTKDQLVIVDDISNVKLQKWNHIVVNQENNIVDVFVNGELHKSTDYVIPENESSNLYIGTQPGVHGEVCNVMFFKHILSTEKISKLYNDFSEKNPPTV